MNYKMHHVQVTVSNVEKAESFYDKIFSALGFDVEKKYKGFLEHANMQVIEYLSEEFDFGISSPIDQYKDEIVHSRKPGSLQHIAFKAESIEAVDIFFNKVKGIEGINILHNEPRVYHEKIAPNYYALFFESPDGIRFEVFHYPN